MRALVLGCGMQGRAALRDLAASADVSHVTCADVDRARIEAEMEGLTGAEATAATVDAADGAALTELMGGFDVAIDTLPHRFVRPATEAAIAAGVHLVNTNYDRDIIDLSEAAAAADVAILAEMGLDPGIDLVMAAEVVRRFETVTSLRSYGGGIPAPGDDDNPMRYRISWTWEGVLDSYARPARLVVDGSTVDVAAADVFATANMHTIEVAPFGPLEATPNGDAVEYAHRFGIAATATEVGRYTLRWPGHTELWRSLAGLGFLDGEPVPGMRGLSPQDFLVAHLGPQLQYAAHQRDAVILRVAATGTGGPAASVTLDLVDLRDLDTGLYAMNRTVGFTASIAAQMLVTGEIPGRGLLSPIRDVPWEPFVAALAERGIAITEG